MLGATPDHSTPTAAAMPLFRLNARAVDDSAEFIGIEQHSDHDMTLVEVEPMPGVDHNFEEPVARDFAGRPVHPKGWQTIKVNFERYCRLRAEVERKYLFIVFYDPESIECFQRHDIMTKHEGLSSFLAANFVQVMVPNTDPFCDLYLDQLFPINAFPVTAVHDPVTMRRIAVFADVDRKSFKEDCVKRRLSYLSDPDELLGELATIIDDQPQLPLPSEELLRIFGLPVPAKPKEDETEKKKDKPDSHWIIDGKKLDKNLFPPSCLIETVPTLDQAINIAQSTCRYILISVHADSSSEASRAVNRDLWYCDPLLHKLRTKFVVVRLDADVDPMARRILHTPLTGSEPETRAHTAPPYLEVMHPFEPLRIPIFGTDPTTGALWGNARGDVVEEFLLDLVIKHPVTTLGWTQAEAPPAHIVSYETRDWPDGQGVVAVGAMKLDATRESNAGSAMHARPNGNGAVAPGTNRTVEQVQAAMDEDDAAWELVENVDDEL
ncbi:hypothetical protein AMAG_15924 [Allomyces macrogynus ATCC 38327]|uniref:Thioredoxin-like fold domain-containing protein n=1 Tax=Allomyces macrogynus (strain ATCC 38327) TaxID=578462 RepID=A0A0L0TB67_ALLM3|nr:hypothetical protein AMAG_15924 [Allomyces macrogynus ATCC 38327]|eukprot:KNE71982.1 hypothetical protein AMAG_15924 [Allomyces macrogynus ATCC 38327]